MGTAIDRVIAFEEEEEISVISFYSCDSIGRIGQRYRVIIKSIIRTSQAIFNISKPPRKMTEVIGFLEKLSWYLYPDLLWTARIADIRFVRLKPDSSRKSRDYIYGVLYASMLVPAVFVIVKIVVDAINLSLSI